MKLIILLVFGFCSCQASLPEDQEADCDDPEVFSAVDLALQAFNERREGHLFALNVILEARRLAGPGNNFIVKYYLKETVCAVGSTSWQKCAFATEPDTGLCTAQIHTDPYPSITQTCKISQASGKVTASQAGCLGCWSPLHTNSLSLLPIVRHTIRLFNNESDHPSHFEVGEITNAKRQVVSGWKYNFTYLVKETNCSKTEFPDLNPACRPISGGRWGNCEALAYVNISNTLVYALQKCRLEAQDVAFPKFFCAGCPRDAATDDPGVRAALSAALEKYNAESSNEFYYRAETITKATSQVVAGVNYRIDFTIGQTNCSKASFTELREDCTSAGDSKQLICKATVYVIPWRSEVFPKVTCVELELRKLPDLTGWAGSPVSNTLQFSRRPPGFTPFRSARMATNESPTENMHLPGEEGPGHEHGRCHKHHHGHCHKHPHGHKHGHRKPKDRSSEESQEDVNRQEDLLLQPVTEIPAELSTSKVGRSLLQDPTRNPNEDGTDSSDLRLQQESTGSPFHVSLFDSLPDLPEPLASKCPGKPWKPLTSPTALPQAPDELRREDLLPLPGGDPAERHETASSTTFGDFDLLDALY